MTAPATAIAGLLIHALGWALVHSLWQGALIAAAAALALRLIPPVRSRARYATACAALLAMVLLTAATALICAARPGAPQAMVPAPAAGQAFSAQAPAAARPAWQALLDVQVWLPPALPWLVAAWLVGTATGAARRVWAWRFARSLVRRDVWPVSESLAATASALARRLGIRRAVCVLESARVAVPVVIGWLRPVVLLPLSAVTGLTAAQLEAILAHELAHIARCDYLVNLVQAAAETLLFYHPAAWWLSRQIRRHREYCCDDIAAAAAGATTFARALAATAKLAMPCRPVQAAVAADGGGTFFYRVRRLVSPQVHSAAAAGDLLGLALLAAIILSGSVAMASYMPRQARLPDVTDKLKPAAAALPAAPAQPPAKPVPPLLRQQPPLVQAPNLQPVAPVVPAVRAVALPGQPAPAPMRVKTGDRFTYRQDGSLTGAKVNVLVISTFGNQVTLDVQYDQPGGSRRQIVTVDQSAIPSVVATAGQGSLSTVGPAAALSPSVSTQVQPAQWTGTLNGVTTRNHLTNTALTVTPRPIGLPQISVQPGLANPAGTRWVPSP
ncbi:MAG: M56 family metallopeptidase [Planctomycetaceae bacterium]|nr:M56 family metallopeptidase [Planctomycetaceae bacterium]